SVPSVSFVSPKYGRVDPVYHPGPMAESVMESSRMTRQGGGGRPEPGGFPQRRIGDGNGESEVGYYAQASLPDEPASEPGPRQAQKRANFRGNKATILRRMSNLTQKETKNKPNF